MRPFTREITAGGFAFAAGHRRIAISFGRLLDLLDRGGLARGVYRDKLDGFVDDLVDVPADRLGWFGFLCHAGSLGGGPIAFNCGGHPRQLLRAASYFAFAERPSRARARSYSGPNLSIALLPASVILIRVATTRSPPAITISLCIVASRAWTRPTSVLSENP